ncbi:MAG TPA: hypothetical protein PK836_03740 [Syntrophales bacterium]|nr:hypothetical protein [Syntrophales bacterium]HOM06817.1 hypothetical protein [Syntrophales bacterium]HON99488.1 hypothetical protein [Syntrophales bacterium]HPC00777.1 hypothetical protein [Syntrophales bacterium]HPQ06025.1 hypothetical protein [Syntrophales bacterium]
MDAGLLKDDVHFAGGCTPCHGGDDTQTDKDLAHRGKVKRPSEDLSLCGKCHGATAARYSKALHYTTAGFRHVVTKRMNHKEARDYNERVFEQSCRSCHATCGSCHVKAPAVGGISIGLIKGHRFVRRDEGKTCAFCHGGRVYPEYTGDYGGKADVHYQKGMMCMDCHSAGALHGDGRAYRFKEEVKGRPSCRDCHRPGNEERLTTRIAHLRHEGKVSCYGCHSAGEYRHCFECHEGGAQSKADFVLGLSPKNNRTVTTLRLVPTVRDSFKKQGVTMTHYDRLPNYWDAPVHNIRKRTDRTRSCEACHEEKRGFIVKERLIKNGSRSNAGVLYEPRPIPAKP